MTAKVLSSLYTCDSASLTAAELTHRLGVSAASVSKAVQNLESLGMVRRERDPFARRERYCLERGVWYRAWAVRAKAMETWAYTARQGSELMGQDTPAGIRLTEMSDFLGCIRRDLTRTSEEWHDRCIQRDLERDHTHEPDRLR
nr:helix-turn-helix domain-containing protein [Pseudonocardia spinosispora]